jgi:hypothetical protein
MMFLISYVPYGMAGEKSKKDRDRFWRPLTALAEILSAFGVIGVIVLTAQYFVKQEFDQARLEANQSTDRRQGDAYLVKQNACKVFSLENNTFREVSAAATLCTLSNLMFSTQQMSLDDSLDRLSNIGPLPIDSYVVLGTAVKTLRAALEKEADLKKRMTVLSLRARSRPIENDYALWAVAIGVLFGASLKCSRACSEWRHGLKDN